MDRTYIKDLKENIGKKVKINGFVQAIRDQGGMVFLIVRDQSGFDQTIVKKDTEGAFNIAKDLTLESVIEIIGTVEKVEQAPNGVELKIEEIKVLSKAVPELPIPVIEEKSGGETDVTKRLDYRWIDLRKPEKKKIFEVWTELEKGFRNYFYENGYTQLYTPSFMKTASETGADVFEVKYFEEKAYLAQSPQFYKQMAIASGIEKVFIMGPVFRAEPSFTTRHMTEFTGWDIEISYIDSHEDVMDELERIIVSGFEQLKKSGIEVEVPSTPFPKITMEEAKEKLENAGIKGKREYDLSAEEEIALSELIKKDKGHDFVFLTDWPIGGRPFYHMRYEDNPKLTKSFDLLYKGLEIVTGAQREHRYDVLVSQAKEAGMDLKSLEDYLNFFKYGCPPHGGVGMGPARLIMKILDISSVKDATFLPRDVKRLTP
ncbi:MAG: aspartate--tRNA(Asn) ligase [Patescibacteria group bacterium]